MESKYGNFWDSVETKKIGNKSMGHWSSWWRDLVSEVGSKDWFATKCKKLIGNGGHTRFWEDAWGNFDGKLKDLYQRLYRLEPKKDCLVKERMKGNGLGTCYVWDWSMFLLERGECGQRA